MRHLPQIVREGRHALPHPVRLSFPVHILFDRPSALAADYAAVAWEDSPLGPVETWSPTLRTAVDLMLRTRFPIALLWGPRSALVYNAAYVELIADKHPAALGRPAREVFPEVWEMVAPLVVAVTERQESPFLEDQLMALNRRGFLEECWFTFAYSPVRNVAGEVEGVMDIVIETTDSVVFSRRMLLLSQLNERLADVTGLQEMLDLAVMLLGSHTADFASVDLVREPAGGDGSADRPEDDARVRRLDLSLPGSAEQTWLVVRLNDNLVPNESYLRFLGLVEAALRQTVDRVQVRSYERRLAQVQLGMSEAFQRSLLPEAVPPGDLQVEVRYRPALELAQVGGDWYDWFAMTDGSLSVLIGDVAGHDLHAAAAMAQVRNMARGIAHTLSPGSPAAVLGGLDRALAATGSPIIATVVLAQLTRTEAGRELSWSNAGHPPPVLVLPDGDVVLLETSPDLMLGVEPSLSRLDHRRIVEPGTTVVLYTDGLVERRGVSLSEGLTWLQDTLHQTQDHTVAEICDHLLEVADVGEDDVALLVLRA